MSEPMTTETRMDDQTEIIVDNLLWDYATFCDTGDAVAYDASRDALRERIRELGERRSIWQRFSDWCDRACDEATFGGYR